mgnify:CR=1 FL=1
MIDFTNCPVNRFRAYGGANGNKINISYEGSSYMLKFPPRPSRNKEMSYTNGCISEYVACHIFEMLASGYRIPCWQLHGQPRQEQAGGCLP